MKIGMAAVSLEACYVPDRPLADELKVCALAAEGDSGKDAAGIFLVCDLLRLRQDLADRLRRAVAARLGLKVQQVGVAATQNHNAFGAADPAGLEAGFVQAAALAWESRVEAEMAHVAHVPQRPLNFNRRYIHPELGAFTAWYGHAPTAEGGADISYLFHLARQALLGGDIEIPRCTTLPLEQHQLPTDAARVTLKKSDDPLLQALFFRTLEGNPIGSVLRFSAHPVTAGGMPGNYRSGDFPIYVRRRMMEFFGGAAMYIAGPCGDTAPLVPPVKGLDLARNLGEKIADEALKFVGGLTWQRHANVRAVTHGVTLKLRSDLPQEAAEAETELQRLKEQIHAAAAAGNLSAVKRLQERHEMVIFWFGDGYQRWIPLRREELAGAAVRDELFVLRLGDCAILGLPGEPFSQYSVNIRDRTLGDKLLVSEQTNSGLGYIPTAEQFQFGGYGPSISAFEPGVEATLTNAAVEAVELTS